MTPATEVPEVPDTRRRFARLRKVIPWLLILAIAAAIWVTGLTVAVVKTGSMRPTVQPGDLVVSVSPNIHPPDIGSIVATEPIVNGAPLPAIAHRIIGTRPDGTVITKGDYNPNPDPWQLHTPDLRSVVILTIPTQWTRNPAIIAAGIGALVLLVTWPTRKPEPALEPAPPETIDLTTPTPHPGLTVKAAEDQLIHSNTSG